MRYYIDYGTGAGNEWVSGSLAEAKAVADDGARYTQRDICIESDENTVVSTRQWVGRSYEPESDPDTDPIHVGKFGYYGDWIDA